VGARPRAWLPGAIPFAGPEDVPRLRELMAEVDAGAIDGIVFTTPPALTRTLPLYELALLTAARVAERGLGGVHLTVVTPEPHALEVFGPAASRHMLELCANRGVVLKTGVRALWFKDEKLELEPHAHVQANRVVALPELEGVPVEGLPSDEAGFIPIDEHGAVSGLSDVYAAGDGTSHPIKQGGLAAQQADAGAEAIAASLGAAVEAHPFQAKLRGQLLTGLMPTYLSASVPDAAPRESTVAFNPLWWPPTKIAGRYLAPYLSRHVSVGREDELVDRTPVGSKEAAQADAEHQEARTLALTFAKSDADHGDYRSALTWLETVEQLDGFLSPALLDRRADWRRLLAAQSVPSRGR
jgi:sulfide:quinone oxidoreductase